MKIAFTLTGEHARMMATILAFLRHAKGPRFDDPSALCRSWVEAILDADARDDRNHVQN